MIDPESIEQRTYIISGERTPEEWDRINMFLGEAGIHEVLLIPNADVDNGLIEPEVEPYSGPQLNKYDFVEFAKASNEDPRLAGRAWNILTRLYIMKHPPTYLKDRSWNDPERYEYVPLVFDYVPPEDKNGYYDIKGLSKLRLDGLVQLLDILEEAETREDPTVARKRILGDAAAKKTVTFLKNLAKSHSEPAEK